MPTSFSAPLTQRIGPYEVLLDIGSGGMGTISLARATGEPVGASGFARLVAIKRPHGALASEPEVLHRFLDEARLLAQIHHANVVGIHQIGADPGGQFLVLDYIEGGSLDELITRSILHRKKLPPPVVLRIASDMLAGLHAVHEAADVEGVPLRMLHRDVSAENVLVGRDGVTRLVDFGIAKAIISSTATDRACLQGRVPYLAPEYLRREEVDRRLDVYAAGVMLWAALAGKLPWQDASEAQIVHDAVHRGIPPLSSAGVTVAPAIQEIVTRACDREPSQRYATAREMLGAIDDLGRRTGWIASHAEVATLVEELLGSQLRARRTAIAQRLSSPDAPGARASTGAWTAPDTRVLPEPSPAPVTLVIDEPSAAPVAPRLSTHAPVAIASLVAAMPPAQPGAHRGTALGVGLLVAACAVAITWALNDPVGPPSAVGDTPSPSERAPSTVHLTATSVGAPEGPSNGEPRSEHPLSTAPAGLPSSTHAAVPAPVPSVTPSTSASASGTPASGIARPVFGPLPDAVPAALPTTIATADPYRN